MTTAEALARLAEARDNADGPLAEFFDIEVERTGDPAAVAARVQYLTGTGAWA